MIVLLGATGYIGSAFAAELRKRKLEFAALSRRALDYTNFESLFNYVRKTRPSFLINAAGFTGRPNVDACETAHAETVNGNTLFPQTVARVCYMTQTPWGHVSSGCIYSGAKLGYKGHARIERDLSKAQVQRVFADDPDQLQGFTETDEPNFDFRHPPCSFYSGTKALAEESLQDFKNLFIWRLRIPFDEFDHPRNYLTKIQQYPKVYDNINSISHRADFVRACLDLWEAKAPFGTYNITNPGAVTTRQVVAKMEAILKPSRRFEFWKNDKEFYTLAARAPRSNCVLDTSKLLATGVKMRSVHEALDDALTRWQSTPETLRMAAGLPEASAMATLAETDAIAAPRALL